MINTIINVNVVWNIGSPERLHEIFHVSDGDSPIVLYKGAVELMIYVSKLCWVCEKSAIKNSSCVMMIASQCVG